MSLPASQDTTTLRQGYVIKEKGGLDDHIPWTNDTGVAINQGDFVKATPYFGIADEDIAVGATGTIHVGQLYNVGAAMTGSGETFLTWGQEVYWSTTKKKFFESEGDGGRYLVGYIRAIADANGVWRFDGLRYHGAEAST